MKGSKNKIRDLVFLKLFFGSDSFIVSDEEFEYFRKHPNKIFTLLAIRQQKLKR